MAGAKNVGMTETLRKTRRDGGCGRRSGRVSTNPSLGA